MKKLIPSYLIALLMVGFFNMALNVYADDVEKANGLTYKITTVIPEKTIPAKFMPARSDVKFFTLDQILAKEVALNSELAIWKDREKKLKDAGAQTAAEVAQATPADPIAP